MLKTSEKIINLVMARLEVLPDNAELSIVGHGTFTKKELISHVKKDREQIRMLSPVRQENRLAKLQLQKVPKAISAMMKILSFLLQKVKTVIL